MVLERETQSPGSFSIVLLYIALSGHGRYDGQLAVHRLRA